MAVTPAGRPHGLSVVNERPKIIRMTTTGRLQHRYDHRLRDLVHATGDVSIATNLGVPRSTPRGWLGTAATVVVRVDVTNRTASELQREVLELRRRVKKLTALLRLALALLRSSGFTLTHERLPDGRAKIRILRALDRAREFVPLRALLRFLRLSPSRFHAWRRLEHACALDDQSSCPRTSPHRLTPHNFSRRVLAWRVAETFAPANSVAVLVEAGRGATLSETTPVVLADAGVENVNAQVDELIATGAVRRVLAFTELKFSNSMIERGGARSSTSGSFSTGWTACPRSGD